MDAFSGMEPDQPPGVTVDALGPDDDDDDDDGEVES